MCLTVTSLYRVGRVEIIKTSSQQENKSIQFDRGLVICFSRYQSPCKVWLILKRLLNIFQALDQKEGHNTTGTSCVWRVELVLVGQQKVAVDAAASLELSDQVMESF